jgi:phospholipid-binding lipoprotein MlaA
LTLLVLLPVALTIASPQDLPAPAPVPVRDASVESAPPPTVPAAPTNAAPAAEFADPLADPALAPANATVGHHGHTPGDPLEGFNRAMFGINQGLDKAIYRPAALGYQHIVPKPVRSGLRNFFGNLTEPVVFANYLLQFRIGKAVHTLGRFTINSTLGLGGLIDVARRPDIRLPHHRNSFGDTLAWYGVRPGPYVFLPLVGPSTLRDLLGGPLDDALIPALVAAKVVGKPFDSWPFLVASAVIPGLDLRAESDPELRALLGGAVDPYATLRSAWLQNRAAEVAEQHHPHDQPSAAPELGDPLQDPAVTPVTSAQPHVPPPASTPPAAPASDGAQP